MTPNMEQLLAAVLDDLEQVHRELGRVTSHLVLAEEQMTTATDTLEATRVSLGALRVIVAGQP